jgi:uncharacterized membrane protein YdfJ with MMPL/SSD domain
MIGAATILTDPIFQGLAISLLFGLASSTLLTVLVIPAIYVWLRDPDSPPSPPIDWRHYYNPWVERAQDAFGQFIRKWPLRGR